MLKAGASPPLSMDVVSTLNLPRLEISPNFGFRVLTVFDELASVAHGRVVLCLSFLSCPRLGLQAYSYPRTCEHIDQLINAETTDLPLQQIAYAWLCLAKESRRFRLDPTARLNVLP
jgi:hypothetical protein